MRSGCFLEPPARLARECELARRRQQPLGLALLDVAGLRGINTCQGYATGDRVLPELASRDHVRRLLPLLRQALADAGTEVSELDGIAYTAGPGLVGALLTGAALSILSTLGLALRAAVVGRTPHRTSGRNTLEQVADSLNTTGMYSLVRHPLYLGNFVGWLGVALFPRDPVVLLGSVLAYAIYYERIMMAEERFLRGRFGGAFERFCRG